MDGRFFFAAANAVLEGPLSCGIIYGMARAKRTAGIDWWKSAASRYVLMWKSGPSGPRQRREKEEPSPPGTAEAPREFETKPKPPLQRTQGRGTRPPVQRLQGFSPPQIRYPSHPSH